MSYGKRREALELHIPEERRYMIITKFLRGYNGVTACQFFDLKMIIVITGHNWKLGVRIYFFSNKGVDIQNKLYEEKFMFNKNR